MMILVWLKNTQINKGSWAYTLHTEE